MHMVQTVATLQSQRTAKKWACATGKHTNKNRETHDNAQIWTAHDLQRRIRQAERRLREPQRLQGDTSASRTRTIRKQKEKEIIKKPRRHKPQRKRHLCSRETPHRTGKGRTDLSAREQYTELGIGSPRGYHNRQTPDRNWRRVDRASLW